jgi:hypothetical protein
MTRHHLPAVPIAFALLTCWPAIVNAQAPRVIVTPSAVLVTVPVDSSTFHWNLATTPLEVLEYEWQVTVLNGERRYAFGFSLFKGGQARPQTGDLDALLRAGQATVWQLTDSGGTALPHWDISVAAQPHVLQIVVRGAEAVKTLFGAEPPTVSLRSLTPAGRTEQPVSVEYQRG